MRQLIVAAFLFLLVLICCYWAISNSLHLNNFYPAPTVMLPNLVEPRALPSITPGPNPTKLAGFAATPVPSPTVAAESKVPHPPLHVTFQYHPVSIVAPTAPPVTPMPAPAYQAVTPMPLMHTPPPISAPTFPPIGAQPSPSPSPTPSPPGDGSK